MSQKPRSKRALTRAQQRDLDIEIEFIEGVVERDPAYVEALQILAEDYTRREKHTKGLKVDQQLAQLRPDDPITHYNLACSYSLTERFDDAFESLQRAIDLGYRDFKWMGKDPDLRLFRKHPLFRKIRARVRRMQVKIN